MPTHPVFLPGEFHGHRNLVGYSAWARKESDTTERPALSFCWQEKQAVGEAQLSFSEPAVCCLIHMMVMEGESMPFVGTRRTLQTSL